MSCYTGLVDLPFGRGLEDSEDLTVPTDHFNESKADSNDSNNDFL